MIRGGRSFVTYPLVFSNDSKRLLLCTDNTISIFSTSTALQISSLEGHTAPVTAVVVVPASSPANSILCFCWTASLDGTVRYWDFAVPELLKTINVKVPVYSMVIPSLVDSSGQQSSVFAYLSVDTSQTIRKKNTSKPVIWRGQISKCNLTESRLVGGVTLAETKVPELITVGSSGRYFGIRKKQKIVVWKVPDVEAERAVLKKITLHHTKKITVFAFHPTQRMLAAGDTTGRILIWRNFGDKTFDCAGEQANDEDRPGVRDDDDADSCTTWHWHPSRVNLLFFSSDGAYLYSGGKEGVLVVWQLDSGKKKFLPRIGSPLFYFTVSPDPILSAIACADNQIHLVKMPSMEILKTISGIKLPCPPPGEFKSFSNGVAFDHGSALVALRTEDYCIQLYSLFDDRVVSEVQVCERNHQPVDDITVVVTLIALSQDGSMMCTVEVKLPEEGIGGLVCLKFWSSQSQNKKFSLSTVIYEPHRDAHLSAIAFHPTRRLAVSTSYGGDFKVWVSNDGSKQNDAMPQSSGWKCQAVGSYKKQALTAAAFSADGSVLAIAAETVITLWDPDSNVLVAVLGDTLTPIVTLSFVGKSEYLVAASWGSKPQLSVWTMSKLSLSWSYMLRIEAVASATDLSLFAVLALLPESLNAQNPVENTFHGKDGIILLFNAKNSVPVATWSARKANGGSLAFVQEPDGNPPKTLLVYMNGDHEYVIFDPQGEETHELNVIPQKNHAELEETRQFGYASLYGELPEFELKRNENENIWLPSISSEKPWETIFSGSSHNLPPLTKLCGAFLEALLEKRTTAVE